MHKIANVRTHLILVFLSFLSPFVVDRFTLSLCQRFSSMRFLFPFWIFCSFCCLFSLSFSLVALECSMAAWPMSVDIFDETNYISTSFFSVDAKCFCSVRLFHFHSRSCSCYRFIYLIFIITSSILWPAFCNTNAWRYTFAKTLVLYVLELVFTSLIFLTWNSQSFFFCFSLSDAVEDQARTKKTIQ